MKIGFCFLVKKNLSQHYHWSKFFKKADPSSYGIYCHSSKPRSARRQKLLKKRLIKQRVKTKWGDVSLVQATLHLFQAAIDDGCDYVVLLSGACIPLHSFNYTHNRILKDSRTRIHHDAGNLDMISSPFATVSRNGSGYFDLTETKRRYNESKLIKQQYTFNNFLKGQQWVSLTKHHCEIVLNANKLHHFDDVFASDEHYIPTVLHEHGEMKNTINEPITYTNWTDNKDWRHPKRYRLLREDHITQARESGCLFMRKLAGFPFRVTRRINRYKQKRFTVATRRGKNYVIFVHIPKNGGCSVKKYFEHDTRFFNYSHATASEIRHDVGDGTWEESYKFTIVRNPYARVLSAFYFFQRGGLSQFDDLEKAQALGIHTGVNFNKWVMQNKEQFLNGQFPFTGTEGWMHFKRQVDYINQPLDKIFKLEWFEKKSRRGLPRIIKPFRQPLPLENVSGMPRWRKVYNRASLDIISQAYRQDFMAFKYHVL